MAGTPVPGTLGHGEGVVVTVPLVTSRQQFTLTAPAVIAGSFGNRYLALRTPNLRGVGDGIERRLGDPFRLLYLCHLVFTDLTAESSAGQVQEVVDKDHLRVEWDIALTPVSPLPPAEVPEDDGDILS